jgi:hypothetical protein
MQALLIYLNTPINAGDTPAVRASQLVRWNALFRRSDRRIGDQIVSAVDARTMLDEVYGGNHHVTNGVIAYCTAVPTPHRGMFQMRAAFDAAGVVRTNCYAIINFLHQYNCTYGELNAVSAVNLYRFSAAAVPLTQFAGFADWGPGNYGNPIENGAKHFLKHVLNANYDINQALDWVGECTVWWQALNIQLTRRIFVASVPAGPAYAAALAYFPAELDIPLPTAGVVPFITAMRISNWPALLIQWMIDNYRAAFLQLGLNRSQNLVDAAVCNTSKGVFMIGRNGPFFILGRFEGALLGMSSCYVAEDMDAKMNPRVIIWRMA